MANVNRPKPVLSNWGITENYGFYQNDKTTNMGQTWYLSTYIYLIDVENT